MLFVIDVGNSHTVTGLFKDGILLNQYRLKSDRERTADELGIRYHALFSMAGIDKKEITGIILASVVPSLQTAWITCCNKHFSSNLNKPLFVVSESGVQQLIKVKIDTPEDVGADRLVNSIAGWHKFRTDLIIVDFGTAITFDCVTRNCEYIGGAILPGIGISMEALSTRTAKLPHIDIQDPPVKVIGTDTVSAMKSGVMNGFGAMVDGMVNKIKKEMDSQSSQIQVIGTGGMAHVIAPFTKSLSFIDQELTLKGLQIIFEKMYSNE